MYGNVATLVSPAPNEICRSKPVMLQNARPRPVGTRGGCREGRGPCACPRHHAIPVGYNDVPPDDVPRTRTSTRPPHPLYPAPCPYRTEETLFPVLAGKNHQNTGPPSLIPFDLLSVGR